MGIAVFLDGSGNPRYLCSVPPLVSLFLFGPLSLHWARFVHHANTVLTEPHMGTLRRDFEVRQEKIKRLQEIDW